MSPLAHPREGWIRPALALAAVALLVAGAWWAFTTWEPAPPRTVVMATGPEGGASATLATRYRAILARSGIDLRLRPTAGAVENLALDPLTLDIVGFDVTERKGEIEIVEVHDRVSYGVCVSAFQPGIGDVARWVGP